MYVVNEGEVDRFSSPEELNNIYINSRNKWTEIFDSSNIQFSKTRESQDIIKKSLLTMH